MFVLAGSDQCDSTSTVTPTRRVTATLTPQPSETLTPTYVPLLTSTPAAPSNPTYGWLRFVNRWVGANALLAAIPVDVFVNEDRIASGVESGNQTNYYQVTPGAVRVSLSTAITNEAAQRLYQSAGWQRDEQFFVYHIAIPAQSGG